MADIFDYLEWRGDLDIRQVPLCNADYAAICCLSYIPFDGIVPTEFDKSVLLKDAVEEVIRMTGTEGDGRHYQMREDEGFLYALLRCERFTGLRLTGFVNLCDHDKEEQFSAMTVMLPDDSIVIAYRGTDRTIIGWKEDFNMCFADVIPSQTDAVGYLEDAASFFKKDIYVCGHSKGGNLAIYASSFCCETTQRRIAAVRNFDGPGLNEAKINTEGFSRIVDRTRTYVPESSIVGIMLEHIEDFKVVQCDAKGFLQHHVYSWELARGDFLIKPGLRNTSHFFDAAMRNWLAQITPESRERLVDGVFSVISMADAHTIDELLNGKTTILMLRGMRQLDEETKDIINQAYKLFKKSLMKALPIIRSGKTPKLTDQNGGQNV